MFELLSLYEFKITSNSKQCFKPSIWMLNVVFNYQLMLKTKEMLFYINLRFDKYVLLIYTGWVRLLASNV